MDIKLTDEQKERLQKLKGERKKDVDEAVSAAGLGMVAKKLKKDAGIDIDTSPISGWTLEKMDYIFGESWAEVFRHARENSLEVKNLIAIMGKDTRKTTVMIIFMWWLINRYEWLNAFVLRDTLVKSQSQMRMQLRKTVSMARDEYGVGPLNDFVTEANDGMYFVRDRNSKENQKIEMLSFDSIIELGGFTTNNGKPAIFIYDELQNPNSINKDVMTREQFLANYKFIDSKNEAMELTTGTSLPKWIPRHYFLSNRYIGNYPLNEFAEAHLNYYDIENEDGTITKGVKSWMLEDPLNNNFVCKYVGKDDVAEGWEDLEKSMIIYGSKLSNAILRKSKEWEDRQIELINRGNKEDLAVIIGDLFEGYVSARKTYFHSRVEKIKENEFISKYSSKVDTVYLVMDLDFSRQIVIGAKYYAGKDDDFRVFRDMIVAIKCNGVSSDGSKTEMYLRKTWEEVIKYCYRIKKMMPHIQKIKLLMDDKKAQWVGRFNIGEYSNNFWNASKIDFDQTWNIAKRPKDIDLMQDTGTVVDIEHPSLDRLHMYMENSFSEPKGSNNGKVMHKRIEKANDATIDYLNMDEYGLYFAIGKTRIKSYNLSKGAAHDKRRD